MGKASLKQSEPVRLPHDGPLNRMTTTKLESASLVPTVSPSLTLKEAADLLLRYRENNEGGDEDNPDQESPSARLIVALLHDKQLKGQLQALQVFRSIILQQKQNRKQQKQQRQQKDVIEPETKVDADAEAVLAPPLYRFLLEASLSYQTPNPFRRALQSSLNALDECYTQQQVTLQQIRDSVIESILLGESASSSSTSGNVCCWKDPLYSLQEAMTYTPTQERLFHVTEKRFAAFSMLVRMAQQLTPILQTPSSATTAADPSSSASTNVDAWDGHVREAVQQAVIVSNLSKMLLQSQSASTINTSTLEPPVLGTTEGALVAPLANFLWLLLSDCRLLPAESMTAVGIAYARAMLWNFDTGNDDQKAAKEVQAMLRMASSRLVDLPATAVAQGLAATISDPVLLFTQDTDTGAVPVGDGTSSSPLEALMEVFHRQACRAVDPDVRLAALKGIRSLVSRCTVLWDSSPRQARIRDLAEQTLEVVLQAWENPHSRKLGSSIPGLFESLVILMQKFDVEQDTVPSASRFSELVRRVLSQPPNRKGRYLALETLLPITGPRILLEADGSKRLLQDLLAGIGDLGHNTGPIADLWAKILQQLLQEMRKEKGVDIAPVSGLNRKQKRKMAKRGEYLVVSSEEATDQTSIALLPEWLAIWAPSLAQALLSVEMNRRKQVAAFCLPRIVTMVGGSVCRSEAARAFEVILREIDKLSSDESRRVKLPSPEREIFADRVVWAVCEVARLAAPQGLLDSDLDATKQLRESISRFMPVDQLRAALTHSSATIRLVAFQSIECVVSTYSDSQSSSMQKITCELELWKFALPFACKSDGREYMALLLQSLLSFLDRLSQEEVLHLKPEDCTKQLDPPLPILYSFVVDFLLGDIIVKKSAYPGTVMDKEAFTLVLLECIVIFLARDQPFALESKILAKTGVVFHRRRDPLEETTMAYIRRAIFRRELFASLFSLLHSSWDSSRSGAFRLLSGLFSLAWTFDLSLPVEYTDKSARIAMESRGVFLASSPRQREADTGARILSLLYLSLSTLSERMQYMEKLVSLLEHRVSTMKNKLATILTDDSDILGGGELPLAHGIIHSLRLIAEARDPLEEDDPVRKEIFGRMAKVFCRAIAVSLSVVADLREGEGVEGMDEDLAFGTTYNAGSDSKAVKVNPGAIGANGIFSSVRRTSGDGEARRIASQRIVIGSWLLTKETCSAVAAILTKKASDPPVDLVNEAGMLLINTITTLKHTGAAFAAHRALQQIAKLCFSDNVTTDVQHLTKQWIAHLLGEISEAEKIRDSTLRRSTGHALGFLAIMRSEVSSRVAHRPLCHAVLTDVLRLSLPSKGSLHNFRESIGLGQECRTPMFSFLSDDSVRPIQESHYEVQSRIHALNVLRLIILDAPLSQEVFPVIGDAITVAIIGYTDSSWAVRNSSTMVFAAAMLRAIDADKNASNTDTTSSKAITVSDLFRAYPSLPNFLLAVMKGSISGVLWEQPPILPILLLFSRIQPISFSGQDGISQTEPFVPIILGCLDHPHVFIRKGAARALANISSAENQSPSSSITLLRFCKHTIQSSLILQHKGQHWNKLHGALLTIRELVSAAGASVAIQELELGLDLVQVASLNGSTKALAPPSCMMVALDTLAELADEKELHGRTEEACSQIIQWLEDDEVGADGIGASELGALAGRVACEAVCSSIWSAATKNDVFEEQLAKLSRLLNCSRIDVRLSAAKAFKKSIYAGVDNMVDSSNDDGKDRLFSLVALLTQSLDKETSRDGMLEDLVGTHAPTLRRLSRCLLESIAACERLAGRLTEKEVYHAAWGLGLTITAREESCQDEATLGLAPPVIGNACELMSFEIAESNTAQNLDKISIFASRICRHSDPASGWRLRHSAAVALDTSKVLSWRPSTDTIPDWEVERRSHQVTLTLAAFQLLQDGDIDVRYATSRAFSSQFIELSGSSVPEMILMQAFRLSSGALMPEQFTERLFSTILESVGGIEDKLQSLLDELSQSERTKSPSELLNTGTDRKIFEEEEPNSYFERSLTNQLSIMATMKRHNTLSSKSTDQLVQLCHFILSVIQRRLPTETDESDMLHEVTRHNSIFPMLHCLILATTCVVFLGGRETGSVRDMAEKIGSMAPVTMHPFIREALAALATSGESDPGTMDAVSQCCFLIPTAQRF